MKDLSFFLLKNSLGAKMKKDLKSFCNGVGSTSTLNQNKAEYDSSSCMVTPSIVASTNWDGTNLAAADSTPTLEEMILQLELEEEATRKAKLDDEIDESRRRMSCVNNSDILRSARNALNHYPRFSVDGRDSMYRSSFRNLASFARGGCGFTLREKLFADGFDLDLKTTLGLPSTVAGESVVWCKPGVVAKLMGLEAMPVPIGGNSNHRRGNPEEKLNLMSSTRIKRENLKRAYQRQELEKRRHVIGTNGCRRPRRGTAIPVSNSLSGSTTGYCVMKPFALEPMGGQRGWEARQIL